jgi:hypothetical protein
VQHFFALLSPTSRLRVAIKGLRFEEIEHQTALDTTVGPPKPLGARGAAMADTLGPAVPTAAKEH